MNKRISDAYEFLANFCYYYFTRKHSFRNSLHMARTTL